jgi:hypothetical protein
VLILKLQYDIYNISNNIKDITDILINGCILTMSLPLLSAHLFLVSMSTLYRTMSVCQFFN